MSLLDSKQTPVLRPEILTHIRNFGLPTRFDYIRVTLMYAKGNYSHDDYVAHYQTWNDDQKNESRKMLLNINNAVAVERNRMQNVLVRVRLQEAK